MDISNKNYDIKRAHNKVPFQKAQLIKASHIKLRTIVKKGRKRPLDTPKRMIKKREREGKREKERERRKEREGKREKERERKKGRWKDLEREGEIREREREREGKK